MKILSDNAITRTDLDAITAQVDTVAAQVDAKQDLQIRQLRILIGAATLANVIFTLAVKFLF